MTSQLGLQSFDFQPRTRVLFGPATISHLGELAREVGGERAILVSDPGIQAAGHVDKAIESLEAASIRTVLYKGVEENPTTRHVEEALKIARNHRTDLVIGLGGGSSMDCAKGMNFLITNGGRMADYWGMGKAKYPMLPMIAVPTTAGTGSEAQSFALISDEETRQKMACGDNKATCVAAILDPLVTLTQPLKVTATAGIDAIAHAVESYVTTERNPVSKLFAREAWKLLQENFPLVLKEPENTEARSAMLLGAHYAGTAIENSMLGAAHACANPLTTRCGINHGTAVALMLPHVIRFNSVAAEELYNELASCANLNSTEALAKHIDSFRQEACLPGRLSECGVNRKELRPLAQEAIGQWTAKFNPRPISDQDLFDLYERAF